MQMRVAMHKGSFRCEGYKSKHMCIFDLMIILRKYKKSRRAVSTTAKGFYFSM